MSRSSYDQRAPPASLPPLKEFFINLDYVPVEKVRDLLRGLFPGDPRVDVSLTFGPRPDLTPRGESIRPDSLTVRPAPDNSAGRNSTKGL